MPGFHRFAAGRADNRVPPLMALRPRPAWCTASDRTVDRSSILLCDISNIEKFVRQGSADSLRK